MENTKFKIGERATLTGLGTSYNVKNRIKRADLPVTVIIEKIDSNGGRANNDDPRYYGKGWNCRAVNLKKLSNNYPIY
jgi:hypothetical protein